VTEPRRDKGAQGGWLSAWLRLRRVRNRDDLASGRVQLRPARLSDWKPWAELRAASKAFLTPYESTWPRDMLTRPAFARRVRRQAEDWDAGIAYHFLILREADDVLLGGINLTDVRRGNVQSGSLGYWIGAPFARQGYMTEAMRAMLRFAFRDLDLHRIEAATLPDNVPSRRLLEKFGFAQEGYAREYLRVNGMWRDHLTFALLREDWERSPEGSAP
jgi:ribosomal-protein-alanine N-acetyltransferase